MCLECTSVYVSALNTSYLVLRALILVGTSEWITGTPECCVYETRTGERKDRSKCVCVCVCEHVCLCVCVHYLIIAI